MWQRFHESKFISFFGLFTSFGTLLCCALPSTIVLLGFGASLAGFLSDFPQLIWLSDHKSIVFGLSFFMLGVSYLGQKYSQRLSCPIEQKANCEKSKEWSRYLFYLSFGINLIGAFYAFVLPRFL